MFFHWIRKYFRFQCNNFPLHRNEIFWFATNQNILLMCPKKALIRMNQPSHADDILCGTFVCVNLKEMGSIGRQYWADLWARLYQWNPFDSQWCLYEWWKWIFSLGHIHNCLSLILFSTVCLEPGCSESWISHWLAVDLKVALNVGQKVDWKLGCLDATDITLPCPSDGLGDGLIFRCLETQSVGKQICGEWGKLCVNCVLMMPSL